MKTRTTVSVIAVVTIAAVFVALTFVERRTVVLPKSDQLRLALVLEHDTFQLGDEISASTIFKNFSGADFYVNAPRLLHGESTSLRFDIVGEDGTVPKEINPISSFEEPLGKADFHLLEAGGTYETERRLDLYYKFDRPGLYAVRARYHNANSGEDFDRLAWTGTILSSSVSFELVP